MMSMSMSTCNEAENALREKIEETAYSTAIVRAIHSISPDRVVYDPFSLILIPCERLDRFYQSTNDDYLRKTYIDFHGFRARSVIEVATTPDALPQTVILGAGLDTLAWRESKLKDIYEVDQSKLFENKLKKLPSTVNQGKHVMIKADLATDRWDEMLIEHQFNASLSTTWILEGLLYYCSQETTRKIFDRINKLSAKDSRIFFDHWPSNYQQSGLPIISLFRSYVDDPIEEFNWFNHFGWTMNKIIDFSKEGQHYGRHHQPVFVNGVSLDLYFVRATKVS